MIYYYSYLTFGVDCVQEVRREIVSIVSLSLIPNKLLHAYQYIHLVKVV